MQEVSVAQIMELQEWSITSDPTTSPHTLTLTIPNQGLTAYSYFCGRMVSGFFRVLGGGNVLQNELSDAESLFQNHDSVVQFY
jgi:hypothetical protein